MGADGRPAGDPIGDDDLGLGWHRDDVRERASDAADEVAELRDLIFALLTLDAAAGGSGADAPLDSALDLSAPRMPDVDSLDPDCILRGAFRAEVSSCDAARTPADRAAAANRKRLRLLGDLAISEEAESCQPNAGDDGPGPR